jgi:phospholipase/carboxylesterase
MGGTSLEYVDLPAQGEQRGTVIWLHGLGADGHDFEPLMPQLRLAERGIRVILPHAPVQPVTLNAGMAMRAWYDIYEMSLARIDEAGIRQSVALIQELIELQVAAGIDSRHIILAGFSQGGVIALQAGLTCSHPLAGLMSLSSYVALPAVLQNERHAANADVPVFIGHGTQDTVVPPILAEKAVELLSQLGHPLEYHLYEMEHAVSVPQIEDMKRWMHVCIDGMDIA